MGDHRTSDFANGTAHLKPIDYFKMSLKARIYDLAVETPLMLAKNMSHKYSNHIYLKREDMQPVFSFKLRGAYNRMQHLTEDERRRGVIACSAGNHAQGTIDKSTARAN